MTVNLMTSLLGSLFLFFCYDRHTHVYMAGCGGKSGDGNYVGEAMTSWKYLLYRNCIIIKIEIVYNSCLL